MYTLDSSAYYYLRYVDPSPPESPESVDPSNIGTMCLSHGPQPQPLCSPESRPMRLRNRWSVRIAGEGMRGALGSFRKGSF